MTENNRQTNLPTTGSDNPFESYGKAATARSIVGLLLKFNKGDWIYGKDASELDVGTRLIAVMPSLTIGWVKWTDNNPGEQIMGLVADGFVPPKRAALGDLDKNQWDVDNEGEPRDPWQFSNYLVFADPDVQSEQLYTYTTGSKGGLDAIGELCKVYGKRMRQAPDELPIIALEVGSYPHPNKKIGRVKTPKLKIIGWTKAGPYLDLLSNNTGSGGGDNSGGSAAQLPPGENSKPAAPQF